MPYNQYDYTTQPTQEQRQVAQQMPGLSWTPLFKGAPDLRVMKAALSQGPIIAATQIYQGAGWNGSGDIALGNTTGSFISNHAICIVGYDDNYPTPDGPGAFKFINSWGADWGQNGYGRISYAYAQKNLTEAETLYIKTSTK